jgi:hypothetical protein
MPCRLQNYSEKKTQNEQRQSLSDTDKGSYLIRVVGRSKPCFCYAKTLAKELTLRFKIILMGRPRVGDQDKRVVQVNIRLTKEEHEKVIQYSQASGLSPASWMRRKVFTGKFPPVKLSPVEASMYNELRSIGVNLNQIARTVNQGDDYKKHLDFIISIWITIQGMLTHLTNYRQSG